jgi:hypothetical protein
VFALNTAEFKGPSLLSWSGRVGGGRGGFKREVAVCVPIVKVSLSSSIFVSKFLSSNPLYFSF